jgi:uncharacterized protein (TIGR03000 family)
MSIRRFGLIALFAATLWQSPAHAADPGGGWYWPNIHWPSEREHFTSGDSALDYRVYPPGLRGEYYILQPADLEWVLSPSKALVEVRVPVKDATVVFQNQIMGRQGRLRRFISPALEKDSTYVYEVQARWFVDDRKQESVRKVRVHAGERVVVDFTTAQDSSAAR